MDPPRTRPSANSPANSPANSRANARANLANRSVNILANRSANLPLDPLTILLTRPILKGHYNDPIVNFSCACAQCEDLRKNIFESDLCRLTHDEFPARELLTGGTPINPEGGCLWTRKLPLTLTKNRLPPLAIPHYSKNLAGCWTRKRCPVCVPRCVYFAPGQEDGKCPKCYLKAMSKSKLEWCSSNSQIACNAPFKAQCRACNKTILCIRASSFGTDSQICDCDKHEENERDPQIKALMFLAKTLNDDLSDVLLTPKDHRESGGSPPPLHKPSEGMIIAPICTGKGRVVSLYSRKLHAVILFSGSSDKYMLFVAGYCAREGIPYAVITPTARSEEILMDLYNQQVLPPYMAKKMRASEIILTETARRSDDQTSQPCNPQRAQHP